MITLDLPYPPSLWALYRNWGKNRTKTERYKTWLRAAGNELLATARTKREPIKGRYVLVVLAGRPDKRRRDLDNLSKATCDLLTAHSLISDDHLAESVTVAWSPHVPKRRIHIFVWPYSAEREAGWPAGLTADDFVKVAAE